MDSRITLTVKLVVGKDDALIAWLATIPARQRQALVKQVLGEALHLPSAHPQESLAQLRADVAWLRQAWGVQRPELAAVSVPISQPAPVPALSSADIQRRQRRIAQAAW